MAELDYVDDLDLLEDYDLREGDSDFSSDEDGRGRVKAEQEELSSDYDEEEESKELMNLVIGLCSALGGPEEVVREDGKKETIYRPGDDCLGCLRDLRKLWKHDDEDLARRVAHAYSVVNVLHNDLVPIVLTCAGTGERGDKLALAATDLITALTWPLDVLDELRDVMEKELDESKLTTLPELQRAQVNYKSSILRVRGGPSGTAGRDFLSTVMNFVLLPSLSKSRPDRTERDLGTINMCLHLFRNLLAIKDPIATSLNSAGLVDLSMLQSKLVLAFDKSKVLDTFLMLSSSAERRDYEDWNAITAECVYHLVVGSDVKALLASVSDKSRRTDQGQAPEDVSRVEPKHLSERNKSALLTSLLTEASQKRANVIASASSRHSRFGTTISFLASDGHRGVARQASSLRKSVEQLEAEEKARTKRRKPTTRKLNEKGAPGYRPGWSKAAQRVIIRWSDEFVKHGLESLSRTLIEDMRREREKLGDLDVARVHFIQLVTFYLEYFLLRRGASPTTKLWDPSAPQPPTTDQGNLTQEVNKNEPVGLEQDQKTREQSKDAASTEATTVANTEEWPMSIVSYFADKWPFALAHLRIKNSLNDKNWLEMASAVRLWVVMLKIMEAQELSIDEEDRNGAEWVQANVHGDNEMHETAKMVTICYKRQTFGFLETIIQFACAYPRSLERYMKGRESMLVRAKVRVRKQMRQEGEHEGDEEEVEKRAKNIIEDAYKDRVFTFNTFQDKLSSRFLADTCLDYVMRWQEFNNPPEQLDTVVRVMHRIAIKGNGLRMFYQAHQRAGFALLSSQMSVLEAVAPKAANNLKQLIKVVRRSWEKLPPDEQAKFAEGKKAPRQRKTAAPLKDIEVKAGHGVEEKLAISIGLLLEQSQMGYVNWVKSALEYASAQRKEIVLNTYGPDALNNDNEAQAEEAERRIFDVQHKFERHVLPFDEGDQQLKKDAASLPSLKLLCRLLGLEREDISEDECILAVPATLLPEHLDSDIALIEKFIRSPFDTGGEPFSSFVQNIRKPRERKLQEPLPPENLDGFLAPDSSENESSDGEFEDKPVQRRRKMRAASDSDDGDNDNAGGPDDDDDDDEGVTKHQRALQRHLARKQRKKERMEKKAAEKEERAKQRKLKKKVYRPGDDGKRPRGGGRGRRMKASAMPIFQGLEAALDDTIEDSDEEMAELDRAIAKQRELEGPASQEELGDEAGRSSPVSPVGRRLLSSPSPASSPVLGRGHSSSPPTSPGRSSPPPGTPESPTRRPKARPVATASASASPASPSRRLRDQSPLDSASSRHVPLSEAKNTAASRDATSSPAGSPVARRNANLSSPFVSPLTRAVSSARTRSAIVESSDAETSPMSRALTASRNVKAAQGRMDPSNVSGRHSSPEPSSSGSNAIMSRWKAFANHATRQEPKSLFIFSDDEEDELDELAEEGHPAAGATSSSAFKQASQQRSKPAQKKKATGRSRAPLAIRNLADDEEDELIDELDPTSASITTFAPAGSKAKGMQSRGGAGSSKDPSIRIPTFGAALDLGAKRKRTVRSDDD